MTAPFVLVTATREKSEISAVVAADEWQKLFELADALPSDCTWTAKAHESSAHRSESVPVVPVPEHETP